MPSWIEVPSRVDDAAGNICEPGPKRWETAAGWLVIIAGWTRQADHDTAVWLYSYGARDLSHVQAWYRTAVDGCLTAANFLIGVLYVLRQHWASAAGPSTLSQQFEILQITSLWCLGESLVPRCTRGSVSILSVTGGSPKAWCLLAHEEASLSHGG
jgi:hypothetical protein